MYKKKLKSQLDMRTQGPLKSKHNNNARLHNNTLNTKFIELRGIMESVIGAFHNTFPLLDRLLLKRPRVKIKWHPFWRECTHWYLTHFWLKDLIFDYKLFLCISFCIFHVCIVYILIHTTLLSKHSARSLCKPQKVKEIGYSTNHSYWPIKEHKIASFRHINTDIDKSWIYIVGGGSWSHITSYNMWLFVLEM